MKRTLYKYIIFLIFLVSICFLSAGISVAGAASGTQLLAANDQPAYEVPEGKQQKWQSLQNLVKKELDSCIEDCGNDSACLKRCEDVSKVRLDREYKKLMSE
jgi:hypothetical protein